MTWLLLDGERRELAAVTSTAEFFSFRQRFWARRDPDPSVDGNPVYDQFFARVADADQLYPEPELRGSVTDRGRALILLGPPNVLRHSRQRVPALSGSPGGGPRATTEITRETWTYFVQDLPEPLQRALRLRDGDSVADVSLVFVLERRGARLIEGESHLRAARDTLVLDSY